MNIEQDPRFERTNKCWCNWESNSESEFSKIYNKCERCGTHFSKYFLKPAEVAKFYNYQQYWQDRQKSKAHPTLEERGEVLVSDGRIQFWKETINRYLSDDDKTALEIGCAEASLLIELENCGWKTIGLEPDSEVAKVVRERTGLDIRQGVFPEGDFSNLDLIVACDVLEHITEPRSFLEEAWKALKPDGILLVQLPIIESKLGFDQMNSRVFDPEEHAFIYTRDSIATLLGANNFQVLENDKAWSIAHEIVVARKSEKNSPMEPKLLANLSDTFSSEYTGFIDKLNKFAAPLGLRQFSNWSKIWEYPRIWYDQFGQLDFSGLKILDIGSEQSPWPWHLAKHGAEVTIIETAENWTEQWAAIREKLKVNVGWEIVNSCHLPLQDASFDAVTSFSVIEHQTDKDQAIDEMIRVLKPDGLLGLSFDLIVDGFDMSYPDWNGRPWTLPDFEKSLLDKEELVGRKNFKRNEKDIPSFLNWHRTTAPHHNYVCGAVVLKKALQSSTVAR